jgi:hypothetical protein
MKSFPGKVNLAPPGTLGGDQRSQVIDNELSTRETYTA